MARSVDGEEVPESQKMAFEFVTPSYTWMLHRLEAVERRIEGLLTFIAAVTLAIPLATMAMVDGAAQFDHWSVIVTGAIALACVLGAVMLRLEGRQTGTIVLVDPGRLDRLSKEAPAFCAELLYFAGQHFDRNEKLIRTKTRVADRMSLLLLVEIIAGAIWAYRTMAA